MSVLASSLRMTTAGLALAVLLPATMAPTLAQACTTDMYVPEPLELLGTWPAQDEAGFPTDGVVRVQVARIASPEHANALIGVHITDLETAAELGFDRRVRWVAGLTELRLLPQTPWRAGGRYRLEVINLDTDTVVTDLTWQVGAGPAPAVAFAAQPDAWCLDQVEVAGECIGGFDSCNGCEGFAASTVETRARLTLTLPDPEVLAQTGRTVVQVSDRGGPALLDPTATHQIWWGEGNDPTCIDLEIHGADGIREAQLHACPPATLAACAELSFTGDSPSSGNLDAGVGTGEVPAGQDKESDGCQSGPGAPGVPLFAGLLALGLVRRRRRG